MSQRPDELGAIARRRMVPPIGPNRAAWLLHNLPGFAALQWWFARWREKARAA